MTNPVGQNHAYGVASDPSAGGSNRAADIQAGQPIPKRSSPEGTRTGAGETQPNATFLAAGVTGSAAKAGSRPVYTIPAGRSDETRTVQAALDAASARNGTVVFAPGTHTFGSVRVSSNTHIVIGPQVTIRASTDHNAYPPNPGSHHKVPSALFNAKHASNVVIDGGGSGQGGTIDGQGGVGGWYAAADAYHSAHPGDNHGLQRPRLIDFEHGSNITIQDINLQNAPKQHIVVDDATNVTIRNVNITAPAGSPNTDGIDLGGDTNVLVQGGRIDVGDDNVAIEGGTQSGNMGPSSNILIDGQTYLHGHGVSIGSNTSKGVHDVTVQNATFNGTDQALRIKSSADRGGPVSNITYRNITVENAKNGAIDVNMNYAKALGWKWTPTEAPEHGKHIPHYSQLNFDNIKVDNSNLGRIWGLSNSHIDGVHLSNLQGSGIKAPLQVRDATIDAGDADRSEFEDAANSPIN